MKFSGPANPCRFTLEQSFKRAFHRFDCVELIIVFKFVLLGLLHVLFTLYIILRKVLWINEGFNIRFNQYGLINRAYMFLTMHFLKLYFTTSKVEQPLYVMILQEKEEV